MKNILVPCDFSKHAVNAFRLALQFAEKSRGKVHLVHIIELPVLVNPVPVRMDELQDELKGELASKAREVALKLITRYNTSNVEVIDSVRFGGFETELLSHIRVEGIDLVIMGSQGAAGIREYLIGSNSERIVRHSPVPVLVVKQYFAGPLRKIVFPTPFEGPYLETLVTKIKELQRFLHATLHIVWINTPSNFNPDWLTRMAIDKFVSEWKLEDYTTHIYNHKDEEEGIIQFARSIAADLIAMGTHGRSGFAHLISGSLTEDVVNHTPGLVWTFSSGGKLREEEMSLRMHDIKL